MRAAAKRGISADGRFEVFVPPGMAGEWRSRSRLGYRQAAVGFLDIIQSGALSLAGDSLQAHENFEAYEPDQSCHFRFRNRFPVRECRD